MHTKFRMRTGVAALAAAAAILGSVAISAGIAEAGPTDVPSGSLTLTPSPGNSSTNFALGLPSLTACPGDASAGWQWGAFVAPSSANVGSLFFNGGGLVQTPSGQDPALYRNLRIGGSAIVNQNPNVVDGLISPTTLSSVNLTGAVLTPGSYNLVVACRNDGTTVVAGSSAYQVAKFWTAPITVAALAGAGVNNFTYAFGAVPTAPLLEAAAGVVVTATTAVVDFTQATATPPVTGFTATVTPSAGVTNAPLTASSTSISFSGLTTGTTYTATLVSANTAGTSPVSNSVTFIPTAAPQPAIPVTFTPGVGKGTVKFTAPVVGASGFTAIPNSYTLTVSPAPGSPGLASYTIPAAVGEITQLVDGLTAGTVYTFSLAPTYVTPNAGPTTTVTGSSNSAQVVQQRITVARPVGQLILTQRCGVNGALPALAGTNAFPGFPGALTPVTASGNQVGTTPDITPATLFPNGGVPADSVTPDPQFNNYPFPDPATYPTECGVSLGTAKIITGGTALDGQYFAADGFINEVTISDLRDTDSGWEVRGQMSNFTGTTASSNVVSGNYLGWTPYIQNFTAPIAGGYGGQIVTAGAQVLPGTGATAATTGQGLGSGRRLAQAAPNAGLGVAQMDARLRMLIPATAKNDTYVGILNFTVLDNGNGTAP